MGRLPKAYEIHKLEKGIVYADPRDRHELEPRPSMEVLPRMPKGMTAGEKREWRYFRKICEVYRIFNAANGPTLELLARNMAAYRNLSAKVAEQGIIVMGKGGFPAYNPHWTAMNIVEAKVVKGLQELGLSTTALAKIGSLSLKAKKQREGMEALLD